MSDISLTLEEGTPISITLATAATVTSTETPKALGTAAVGTLSEAARADHVHPIGNVIALAVALG
jgi:hypothetical protein